MTVNAAVAAKHITWAAIVDGKRLRIFERARGKWSELGQEAVEIENPPSREHGTERPGRVYDSRGQGRHAVEPRSDPHEAAKAAFAGNVAARLERAATEGRYDQLLLVAPPKILGYLRDELGRAAQARLSGSIDKDLTPLEPAAIISQLTEAAS